MASTSEALSNLLDKLSTQIWHIDRYIYIISANHNTELYLIITRQLVNVRGMKPHLSQPISAIYLGCKISLISKTNWNLQTWLTVVWVEPHHITSNQLISPYPNHTRFTIYHPTAFYGYCLAMAVTAHLPSSPTTPSTNKWPKWWQITVYCGNLYP